MEIRAIADDELGKFRQSILSTFGGDPAADPKGEERLRAILPPGRSLAAFDRATLVGTSSSFALTLTVPGGTLPMAGLTMVTVRPTHTRRGVLRALMAAHLEDARAHGEPVSGLWASEAAIYGRFGYGVAAEGHDLSFRAPGLSLTPPGGQLDDLAPLDDGAIDVLPPIYDALRLKRPGMITRSEAWWRHRRFTDRSDVPRGASPKKHVLALRAGAPTGYLTYRLRGAFEDGLPSGTVEVEEMIALEPRAEATLWQFLLRVDLFPKVTWWNAPVDALLPWIVSDPRRLRTRRTDTLWLRIADLPAALSARRYGSDGALRLEMVDGGGAAGAGRQAVELVVEDGAARCQPTDGEPELRIDRAALGSLYLGAASATLLARAGRARGDAEAVARADRMFATSSPPWCVEIF